MAVRRGLSDDQPVHYLHAAFLLAAVFLFDCEVFIMCEVKRYCAGDLFASGQPRVTVVLADDFDRVQAVNQDLQARLTVQDQRVDELDGLLRTSLLAMSRIYSAGRDFIVGTGCDCDSVELMMENDPTAREIRAALNPTAEAASHE